MREWCSCGAAIRGRKRTVMEWRTGHLHTTPEPDPEPQPEGTTSLVEHAGTREWDSNTYGHEVPTVISRIGFTPNGGQR